MRNVQIIDGADNCAYEIYSIPIQKFNVIFPNERQNIEFIEDLMGRLSEEDSIALFDGFWDNPQNKESVQGIHGTLFYELDFKKKFYPTKNDGEMVTALDLI